MKFAASTAIALATIALSGHLVAGAPMQRRADEPNEKNIADLMGSALAKWLASQNVKDFRALSGGKQVTWIGGGTNVTQEAGNAILFKTADNVVAFDDQDKESFFSDAYKVFVQDVSMQLNLNGTKDSPELTQRANDADAACGKLLSDITKTIKDDLLSQAKDNNPDVTPTNDQLNEAVQKEARWRNANANCTSSQDAFTALYDKEHGFNFALFAQASKNMRPIAESLPDAVEGVTMPADTESTQGAGDDPFNSPSGQGNVLPQYTIPVLQSTLEGWQARADDAQPEFTWESKSEDVKTIKELNEGSAKVGLSFGRFGGSVGASHKDETENSQTTAQEFSVKFGGIALVDIETGLWFDGYRMAAQAEKPTDDKSQPAKGIFRKHFGCKSKPLPAAHYNKQAVVAYKPEWQMKFSSSESYKKFTESSFDVSAQYLFVDVAASGKTMKDVLETHDDSNTAIYKPTSKNGVILGYVVDSYQFGDDSCDEIPISSVATPSSSAAGRPSGSASASGSASSAKPSGSASASASGSGSSASASASGSGSSDSAAASSTDNASSSEPTSSGDAQSSASESASSSAASASESA